MNTIHRCPLLLSALVAMPSLWAAEPAPVSTFWAATHAAAFAGNTAGDGILWRHNLTGASALWLMNGDAITAAASLTGDDCGWSVVQAADFNGDGFSDLLWRRDADGAGAVWLMHDTTVVDGAALHGPVEGWQVMACRDYDGDGRADLLWRDATTNRYAIWLMNGLQASSGASLNDGFEDWSVAGTGDLDHDGCADLVWRRDADGASAVWLMNGLSLKDGSAILPDGSGWNIARMADFNADGCADILWRHEPTGSAALWLMQGMSVNASATLYGGDAGWSPAQVADFSADGCADILWRQDGTGTCSLWLMNGTSVKGCSTVAQEWIDRTPALTGDFNRDGCADIVWSDVRTGAHSLSLMSGTNAPATSELTDGFAERAFRIDTTIEGDGSLVFSPVSMNGCYAEGSTVHLTAQPGSGKCWVSTTGDVAANAQETDLVMDGDRSARACFGPVITGRYLRVPEDYALIQTAIDAGVAGDVVLVDEGTRYENINFHGRNLTVASHFLLDGDLEHITCTVIDGSTPVIETQGSVVTITTGETRNAILTGFTLANGIGGLITNSGTLLIEGGGILIDHASPTIRFNVITNNSVVVRGAALGGGGGGISSFRSFPLITNNVITSNTAPYAGGVVLNWSSGVIRNNIIAGNSATATWGTGGLMVWSASEYLGVNTQTVENNTIINNTSATTAGGMSIDKSANPTVQNLIIWGNTQATGGQLKGNGTGVIYSDIEGGFSGTGNLNAAPLLTAHLEPGTGSPCIDTGNSASGFNDPADPASPTMALAPSQGRLRNDMGAYGGPGAAALPAFTITGTIP